MPDYEARMPSRMRNLPKDEAGRPVPKFVEYIDGKPDFRLMSSHHMRNAVMNRMCWVCGQPLGKYAVFTAGPMCLVNLNSAEPPSHYECALYSATHCPFLTNPDKTRRETGLPDVGLTDPAGIMITRNPGVTCLIVVRYWTVYRDGPGLLFNIGTQRLDGPVRIERVEWYCRGREATRAEVDKSMETGLPALVESCDGDPACLAYLQRKADAAQIWLPDE